MMWAILLVNCRLVDRTRHRLVSREYSTCRIGVFMIRIRKKQKRFTFGGPRRTVHSMDIGGCVTVKCLHVSRYTVNLYQMIRLIRFKAVLRRDTGVCVDGISQQHGERASTNDASM